MIKRIVEDYESRLVSVDPGRTGPDAGGKAEHERFADGAERFKVRLRKLALQDGTSLDIHLRDTKVGSTTVQKGAASFEIGSADGEVPRVQAGDRIVVAYGGAALFGGVFIPD